MALSEEGDQSWMMPSAWEQHHRQIRHCYQYIQMKVKLFFIFEEQDSAIQLTFRELMNFPRCPEEYFPRHYFVVLLEFLTLEQKKMYLMKFSNPKTI